MQGVITFFVLANFTLATFMDPGVIPKGNYIGVPCNNNESRSSIILICIGPSETYCSKSQPCFVKRMLVYHVI